MGVVKPHTAVPAVSWLLCAHVADAQLQLALQSCMNQTFTDFELVVVANGPAASDVARTVRAWVGCDPRLRIYTTEVKHLVFSLSLGLHHARASLVARMDSDDLSRNYRLERQVAFMGSHPDVTVLGTSYEIIDVKGLPLRVIHQPTSNIAIRRALLWGNPLCHPSVMFRRDAVLDVGGYMGGLHAEDYDLWARLSNNPAIQFGNLHEVCLAYRNVGVGVARKSRIAYATMAGAQFRNLVEGQGLRWAFSAVLSALKAFIRAR